MKAKNKVSLPSIEQVETEKKKIEYTVKYKKAIKSTLGVLVVVAAIAVLVATLLLPILQISGKSMEPTLKDGDIVALIKTDDFERGELVGFYYQSKVLLKRVIGLPGDKIDISADGTVSVNDEVIVEPYITQKALGECDIEFPYTVPEERYFVLGDHRLTSIDSRSSAVGCIEKSQIVGRVFLKIWPFSDISFVN